MPFLVGCHSLAIFGLSVARQVEFTTFRPLQIGQPLPSDVSNSTSTKHEMIPYFNEMATEPIETFLME